MQRAAYEKQVESFWVKVRDRTNKGHLVVFYMLPEEGEPVDEAFLLHNPTWNLEHTISQSERETDVKHKHGKEEVVLDFTLPNKLCQWTNITKNTNSLVHIVLIPYCLTFLVTNLILWSSVIKSYECLLGFPAYFLNNFFSISSCEKQSYKKQAADGSLAFAKENRAC